MHALTLISTRNDFRYSGMLVQHLNFIPHYVLYKLLHIQLHLFYIPMFSTWSTYQPKCSPWLAHWYMSKWSKNWLTNFRNLSSVVVPKLTLFQDLDQHGRVEPLFLQKMVCINLNYQNPKISVANHPRNNLKPMLHLRDQYHSPTHAPLLTYLNDFSL